MAIIKGFQLKAIKSFRGHEGEPLKQANLYFNNKKVGFVSEDGHGGYPKINLDKDIREKWGKTATEFLAEHPEETIWSAQEFLFYQLFELSQDESEFKKSQKKGFAVLAIFYEKQAFKHGDVEGFRSTGREFVIQTTKLADVEKYEKGELKDMLFDKKVYTSLEDFIIS